LPLTFGYKSHISIDQKYGLIRGAAVTSAAHSDGKILRDVTQPDNTGSHVWAGSANRSKANEVWQADKMLTSKIHRKKPVRRPMPPATSRANGKKSSIRARVEHLFGHHKNSFGLFVRTIGLKRAEAKLTLANIAQHFHSISPSNVSRQDTICSTQFHEFPLITPDKY
jgi:IS5 family transposase